MSGPNDPRHRAPAEPSSFFSFEICEDDRPSVPSTPRKAPTGAESLPRPFGDYELLGEVARGGMGVVYKARQHSLDRVVALKMIRDIHLADVQTVERFYQEARAAAALDHPGIVPIYEVGQHDGQHYFTMALVEGTNLETAVRQEGLPAPEAAAVLVAAVADAVEYAHEHGVIHRDLKPANILLEGRLGGAARPRVTDFGLAKNIEKMSGLTAPGEVMGSLHYMAPEQARGDHRVIGPRTDVHGLGAILYFLLTGNPPFTGPGGLGVLRLARWRLHHDMEETVPSPSQLNPRVPKGLEAICLKCLEQAPERRYATAAEVAQVLRVWADLPSLAVPPSRATAATIRQDPHFVEDPPVQPGQRDLHTRATIHLPSGSRSPPPPAGRESPPGPNVPSARSGRRRALVAAGASALLVTAGFILLAPWMRPPAGPPDGGAGRGEFPVKVKGHETTYRDFALKVEMSGGSIDRAGVRLLNAGEEATFRIEVERDAYVGIWNVAPDRTIVQLFPNEMEPDHLFRAGQPRTVPRRDIALVAVPSGGKEQVWVVASTGRWELPEGRRKGPYLIFETAEEQRKWAQIMERGFELRNRERVAVAEFVLDYQVSPRK
jgi:eukaryotic-like serine/threonine-protein kinase